MNTYTYNLNDKLQVKLSDVGGKGFNLNELSKIDSIRVPKGFCVTTDAYKTTFKDNVVYEGLLEELTEVNTQKLEEIGTISKKIREHITSVPIPEEIVSEINTIFNDFDEGKTYAVRSSATAEDLPGASFAGQHDTYLNIKGIDSIVSHISKCWASLFTERAITYRILNKFDHALVHIAVVVQEMVMAECSGVMFTADPISSDRKVTSIDASYGLGEIFVSGHVNADHYSLINGSIIECIVSDKATEMVVEDQGGTKELNIASERSNKQVLAREQLVELEELGRRIEAYFEYPQDIEWCLFDKQIYIVQSRPITTLYPKPENKDDNKHIYVSSGHLQMMTDPIKPLGMYFFSEVVGNPPYIEIGGRMYLDFTTDLSSYIGRKMSKFLLKEIGDTLLTNAVTKLIDDKTLMKSLIKGKGKVFTADNSSNPIKIMFNAYKAYKDNNPNIVKEIIDDEERNIKIMQEELALLSGNEALDYIVDDHHNRRVKLMPPRNAGVMTAVMLSARGFDKKVKKWLGETNAADSIIMSIPNSVTTKTGFALLDVTDVIRKHEEVIKYLDHAKEDTFFEDIRKLKGGDEVIEALDEYLNAYGMRCSGDIDITVPRWIENPIELVPTIISNLKNFEVGASDKKHKEGVETSEKRIQELVDQAIKLPGGKKKAKKIRRMADLIRNNIGYREYPKFSYMKRYYSYKQAMLQEAKKLVDKDYIDVAEDIFYLYFDELRAMVNGKLIDKAIIHKRKEAYIGYAKLTPPRVITSDCEIITGDYEVSELPENSLPGLAVSAGIVEGRARVIKNLKDSFLEEGDILITEFTDPSWTPAFVSIKGLVTEVGGLSTHGAVIAREYGLPAVVSVKDATRLIKDGQRIRLNGNSGFIEIIEE